MCKNVFKLQKLLEINPQELPIEVLLILILLFVFLYLKKK